MLFCFENQKALESIYFHDCVYQGFVYDYDSREIRFDLTQHWQKIRYHLRFQGVAAVEMQGCGFWGGGNSVYHLWIDEDPAYFRQLEAMQTQKPEQFRYSYLDQGVRYLSVIMQLISGDELKITCESVDVTEESL